MAQTSASSAHLPQRAAESGAAQVTPLRIWCQYLLGSCFLDEPAVAPNINTTFSHFWKKTFRPGPIPLVFLQNMSENILKPGVALALNLPWIHNLQKLRANKAHNFGIRRYDAKARPFLQLCPRMLFGIIRRMLWHSIWHVSWHSFLHRFSPGILCGIHSRIASDILPGILWHSCMHSCILFGVSSGFYLTGLYSCILSGICVGILFGSYSGILVAHFHSIRHIFWHSIWHKF